MTTVMRCCLILKSILTKIFYLSQTSWHFSWPRSLCKWVLIAAADPVWSCPRGEGTADVPPPPGLSAARKRSCALSCRSCCHWCSRWSPAPCSQTAAGRGWTWPSPGHHHSGNLQRLLKTEIINNLILFNTDTSDIVKMQQISTFSSVWLQLVTNYHQLWWKYLTKPSFMLELLWIFWNPVSPNLKISILMRVFCNISERASFQLKYRGIVRIVCCRVEDRDVIVSSIDMDIQMSAQFFIMTIWQWNCRSLHT